MIVNDVIKGIVLVVALVMIVISVALGISSSAPSIPLWASFLIIGLVLLALW